MSLWSHWFWIHATGVDLPHLFDLRSPFCLCLLRPPFLKLLTEVVPGTTLTSGLDVDQHSAAEEGAFVVSRVDLVLLFLEPKWSLSLLNYMGDFLGWLRQDQENMGLLSTLPSGKCQLRGYKGAKNEKMTNVHIGQLANEESVGLKSSSLSVPDSLHRRCQRGLLPRHRRRCRRGGDSMCTPFNCNLYMSPRSAPLEGVSTWRRNRINLPVCNALFSAVGFFWR